jgi:hypothetical protein
VARAFSYLQTKLTPSVSSEASSEKIICRLHIFGYNAARSSRRREETLKSSAHSVRRPSTARRERQLPTAIIIKKIFAAVSPRRREKYSSSFVAFFRS